MGHFPNRKTTAAICLAALTVALVASLLWIQSSRQAAAAARSDRAAERLAGLDRLGSCLTEANAARCAFVVRAEARPLERFEAAVADGNKELDALRVAGAEAAATLAAQQLAVLVRSVRTRQRQRFNDRAQLALTAKAGQIGESFRRALTALREEAGRELNTQDQAARRSAWFSSTVLGLGSGVAILVLGLTVVSVGRESTAQRRSAAERAGELSQAKAALAEQALLQAGLEGHFRQAQPLASVGRVAGEMVHDFNGLLGVILPCSEMTLQDLPPDHPAREVLVQAIRAGHRAAALTRRVLAAGRARPAAPAPCDLGAAVADIEAVLRRVAGINVELGLRMEGGMPAVLADRTRLDQALLNLVANARDAMPEGGRLSIEGRLDGGHAVLAVTDTGCGMDEATRARVFEPFFTTKGAGKGTGLGMAIVHDAVQDCGGKLEVDSAPGRGTCVRIYLRLVRS